jgi:hypothetical protein
MLFNLTFPCYLTKFSGKKCLSGKVVCAFFCPAYRSSPVPGMATADLESQKLGKEKNGMAYIAPIPPHPAHSCSKKRRVF